MDTKLISFLGIIILFYFFTQMNNTYAAPVFNNLIANDKNSRDNTTGVVIKTIQIQKGKRKDLQAGAIQKKQKKQSSSSASWSRDANMAFTALDNANFKCENDTQHETFISVRTGNQFVEAHHLIPMEYQGEFSVSIDVPENIISLCPNCHRAFHNSIALNQENLISKFYEKRSSLFKERDIETTREKIFEYYKTTSNNA